MNRRAARASKQSHYRHGTAARRSFPLNSLSDARGWPDYLISVIYGMKDAHNATDRDHRDVRRIQKATSHRASRASR